MSGEHLCRFLLRNPRVLFALFVMESIWFLYFRSCWRVTPRYFWDGMDSRGRLCRVYVKGIGEGDLVNRSSLHLSGRNFICHLFSHCSRASMSR